MSVRHTVSNGAGASGEAVKAVIKDLGIERVDKLISDGYLRLSPT